MNREYTLTEINQVAQELLPALKKHQVIAFHGMMGAGKTTLIQAVCKKLGVEDNMGSPTFSIINLYESHPERSEGPSILRSEGPKQPTSIYHMDLYRLKNEGEAIAAGVEDALYSGSFCFVEWPEKAPALFPDDTLHLYIESKDADIRCIKTIENA